MLASSFQKVKNMVTSNGDNQSKNSDHEHTDNSEDALHSMDSIHGQTFEKKKDDNESGGSESDGNNGNDSEQESDSQSSENDNETDDDMAILDKIGVTSSQKENGKKWKANKKEKQNHI